MKTAKNFAKKMAAISMVACLAAGLAACGSSGSKDTAFSVKGAAESTADTTSGKPDGIYKIVEMIMEGETLSEDEIRMAEEYGSTFYMNFSSDGTVYLNSFGEESSGTWDDSSIKIEGETMHYTLDGDTLTLSEDDISMTLKRSTQKAIDGILAKATASAGADISGESAAETVSSTGYQVGGDYSTDETVLFDTGDCAMTVTGYTTTDPYYGFVVNARCENKTSNKNLMFSVSSASIDGYMIFTYGGDTVSAGNNANIKIEFDRGEMEQAGITSVDEIEMEINVYNSDDWSEDYLYEGTCTIYPTGKSADEVVSPARTAAENESVAVDDDNVTFIILGMSHDDDWESSKVNVYLENRTDRNLTFSWDDVAVNGTMIDPYWAKEVTAGKKAYATISFYDSALTENGIDGMSAITSIEYKLAVSDSDDWSADDLVDATYTYNP